MNKITIAVDGYSSCGKSTIARALASKLDYTYIDSGAMYRAVTLFCLRHHIVKRNGEFDSDELINALDDIHISFQFDPNTKNSITSLNGENIENEIRQMPVSNNVSRISVVKQVRERMVDMQRWFGRGGGVVMDGRDIGTKVFPYAELKLFMTADINIRVQRRLDELSSKGYQITREEVKKNIEKRDFEDTHRSESPLTKAENAIILDNSDLTKEQQLKFVLKLIKDLRLIKKLV